MVGCVGLRFGEIVRMLAGLLPASLLDLGTSVLGTGVAGGRRTPCRLPFEPRRTGGVPLPSGGGHRVLRGRTGATLSSRASV